MDWAVNALHAPCRHHLWLIWAVVKIIGPFLGILVIRCRIIIVIQKGTIILTTTHMTMTEIEYQFQAEVHLGRVFLHKDVPTTIVQELGNHFNATSYNCFNRNCLT